MAVDEQDNPSESTSREAELQRQLDGLQSQVTDLHKAREATKNLELSSEVQRLKEKLDEHSKQLEQSAEKLTQLESENLDVPLDILQVKPGHQEKKLEIHEFMKQYPATPRRKHPKEPRHCSPY
ncbi:hypothetical protein F2Q70_00003596 [Brassica cretica]|uniref:Uncharacterized protein n=1 Tax=Brassica cretica TaxID=69181 RepID=A0A8S9ISL3_BRACR|nr:hypothetical protein F2Q70_00003596 [Brassica cretica]